MGFKNKDVNKIDRQAVDGLLGIEDSLSYKVHEIERHFHNREKWFGEAAVPSGETHIADRMEGSIAPFDLLTGSPGFGSWIQIIGSSDTPVSAGMVKFDGHRFLVTSTDSTVAFIIQIASGESADLATKVAAEEFTEAPYIAASNNNDSGISDIMSIRVPVGEKIWIRAACIGQSAKTISLYFGVHEYE